uniref:hypothetical protein n=1 Tax=Acinetobacter baumannii TaxID=470 RepID=UPI003395BA5F
EFEEFKKAFLEKFFLNERREMKVEEFINLKQGNMSVAEYSFNSQLCLGMPLLLCLIQEII